MWWGVLIALILTMFWVMLIRSDEDFNQENFSWRSAAYWFSFDRIQSWEEKKANVSERFFHLYLVWTSAF